MGNKYACYCVLTANLSLSALLSESRWMWSHYQCNQPTVASVRGARLEDYDQAEDDATGPCRIPDARYLDQKVEFSVDGDVEDVTMRLEVICRNVRRDAVSCKSFEELRIELQPQGRAGATACDDILCHLSALARD